MRLRNLFETQGEEVAVIFGRFNPPHKGHRAAWELASRSPVWFIGTNKSTRGPKDPLPFDVKVEAMKAIWPEVEGHIVAETTWLTLASRVYNQYPNATLLCLTDEDWVTKTIQQYNGKEGAHGFYNFKKIEQKPTPRLSSATALRDAVSKGDRDAFTKAAGVDADTLVAGKPFFDLVAEYLSSYKKKAKPATEDKDPCWKGYKQIGMKKKGGKQVPNCVPKESIERTDSIVIDEGALSTDVAHALRRYGEHVKNNSFIELGRLFSNVKYSQALQTISTLNPTQKKIALKIIAKAGGLLGQKLASSVEET